MLIQQKTVPADATIVVIAGPTHGLLPARDRGAQRLCREGRQGDGDARSAAEGAARSRCSTQFLADWGISAGNDVVLDASGMGQMLGTDASVPVAAQYPPHPITEGFRVMTAYPMARSMTPIEGGSNGHTAQPLVNTSAQSWSEADLAALSTGKAEVGFNADKGDKQGPITLGAAVSAPATVTPPPPSGNATPASPDPSASRKRASSRSATPTSPSNMAIGIAGNRDFFMNSMNWLSQQENLIAIRPRQPEDRRLTLTADQQNRIMILTLFIIPGLVFASGIYTWWRRR